MNRKRYLGHLNDLTIYIALFNVIYLDDFMVSAYARTLSLARTYADWQAKSLLQLLTSPFICKIIKQGFRFMFSFFVCARRLMMLNKF